MSAGLASPALAQRIVYDQRHFQTVGENAVARNAAELTHNQYLEKIDQNLGNINLNAGAVVAAQAMIYKGLSNVNSALKNGRMIIDMGSTVSEILGYSSQMQEIARAEPYLLLFAEDMSRQMKARSLRLVSDVSGYILKEGNTILADYNSRDQLLKKVSQELQIISALVYGAWKAIFWAKQRGVVQSINPFAAFINTDRQHVEEIIRNAKYLKR
ncbi:MAG: hypothetical protein EOO90_06305 [Pedobacter sp.]|nr:MAG: hypothetical protein EOO90_06305 [Pedobacter sp.]